MKIVGIIPARFASQRFPGKPLINIDGKPMIQWVYEACKKCPELSEVIIATDDERIATSAENFGAKCVMTSTEHLSGTDRCAEAALLFPDADAFINIQGDEPRINPEQISELAELLKNGAPIATLAREEKNAELFSDKNLVKVIMSQSGKALYFSRAPIPFESSDTFFVHVGIYGFQKAVLEEITHLSPTKLEITERLEQLRWLENDFPIHVGITKHISIAIDTPEDLKKLQKLSINSLV